MPNLGLGLGLDFSSSRPLGSGSDLTFSPPATLSNVGAYAPLQLTATSASSLPITFEKVSGPCFVENGNLYPTGNGTALVRAVTSQQTIEGSITLSGISGFSSSVPAVTIYFEGAGQQYNPENDEYYCSNYVGHFVYLNRQNSTTWTDGNAILSFNSTYWRFYTPDNSGCGESEARVTSSNGNIIPTTGWTIITGMSTTPQIDLYKPSLSFTGLPSVAQFIDAGQTQSVAGVGLSYAGQAVTLPVLVTTSGACSRSGSTITFTTPAGGAETESATLNFNVLESVFYSALGTSLNTIVRSTSALGDYVTLSAGPINTNGQRFLQYGNNLVTNAFPQGSWNTNEPYLYVTKGAQVYNNSNVRNSTSIIATPCHSDEYSETNRLLPETYNSQFFSRGGIGQTNSQYYIFTRASTGLQPSSSVGLFVNGLTGQNNAFVDGNFIKKTSGANVYYLARNGTRLESPAYSGSVWRFVKDSNIVNHASTDNSTIPVVGWPSGLAIARATFLGRYPQYQFGDRLFITGLSFTYRSISYNLQRVPIFMPQPDHALGYSYISNIFDANRMLVLSYDFKTLVINEAGAYEKILAVFPTKVNGLTQTGNRSARADFEVAWSLGSGVTGDLFVDIF